MGDTTYKRSVFGPGTGAHGTIGEHAQGYVLVY